MQGLNLPQDVWLLDLATNRSRTLSRVSITRLRCDLLTPNGKRIVFDRLRKNSGIVWIDYRSRHSQGS